MKWRYLPLAPELQSCSSGVDFVSMAKYGTEILEMLETSNDCTALIHDTGTSFNLATSYDKAKNLPPSILVSLPPGYFPKGLILQEFLHFFISWSLLCQATNLGLSTCTMF